MEYTEEQLDTGLPKLVPELQNQDRAITYLTHIRISPPDGGEDSGHFLLNKRGRLTSLNHLRDFIRTVGKED